MNKNNGKFLLLTSSQFLGSKYFGFSVLSLIIWERTAPWPTVQPNLNYTSMAKIRGKVSAKVR